jgi:hypothetical protein
MRSDKDSRAHYYQVTAPFALEVRVGLALANVWIGRSQALQDVYETVLTRPGDELHCLPGGDFFIRAGESFEFDTRRHEASEILLHPAPTDPPLQLAKLREISAAAANRPISYRPEGAKIAIGSRRTVPG